MEALSIVTSIAVVLLIGVVFSVLAGKLKIPEVLVLVLAGMVLGVLKYKGEPIVEFPVLFLTSISIVALALIVFDGSAKIRWRELDKLSLGALKFVILFAVLSLIFFSLAADYLLGIPFVFCLILAAINVGTATDIVMSFFKGVKGKAMSILELESVFNTPLTVILPLVIIDFTRGQTEITEVMELVMPFFTNVIIGIGAGIFIAIILFKIMQKKYSSFYSPLAVVVAALLAYVLAENLGGNGVIAVVSLGIFFGNVYLRDKIALLSTESILARALLIFVFVLIGVVVKIPLTKEFFISSLILFAAYTVVRYVAAAISFMKEDISAKEIVFMALCAPKGITTVAVAFLFAINNVPGSVYYVPGIDVVLNITLVFVLYSIVLSSIVCAFQRWFLNKK
ncbi:MAG: cation:proton antiporter [Candidatus Woesearchaeota archaeon]